MPGCSLAPSAPTPTSSDGSHSRSLSSSNCANAPGPSTNSPASAPGSATRSASSSGATTPNCLAIPDLLNQLTHPWFRELWNKANTPALALKLRVSTLAKLLKKHGIRRLNAQGLWEILHAPALTVAPGAAEAAGRALQSLFAQAHTTNQLLAQARQDVRELLKAFSQAHPDDERPDDMTILRSLPGVGGYVLSTLFAEAFDLLQRRDYPAPPRPLRSRPRQHPVRQHPLGDPPASPFSTNSATLSTTGPASPPSTIPSAKPATAPSAPAATPTDAPSAPSATGSSPSPAPCSKTAPSTTRSSPETSSPPEQLLQRKKGSSR